ncbi:DUF4279 domain-containing protein [Arsenicibacter rosenii]|uniref:DUF4279 domain-containing protein n=1 Tax=Arsenicibacter rosenii TaxID=1750698 RepID=A0A1S2VSB6_9BACT|nr:DUF4279 domain-containing protein [Arsenicibacter rosenii]OIN61225.1 hypothetical protein BLX24_03955 [Arsenicibacter rosenii]
MENKVIFKIHDFECPYEVITKTLDLIPTKAWLKGDKVDTISNRIRSSSLWQIESDIPKENPINEHISFMIGILSEKRSAIKLLTEKYECEFTIVSKCKKEIHYNFGAYLDSNALKLIAHLNLSVDIDIYFL